MNARSRDFDFGSLPVPLPADSSVVGPETARHTDQCIADAARWGFCNHTRLRASPAQLNRQRAYDAHVLGRTVRREFFSTLALVLLSVFTVFLVRAIGLLALPLIAVSGIGWLLVFLYGLPHWFTADISRTLPPDTRARLDADLAVRKTARVQRRRVRGKRRKRKGPPA